MARAYRCIAIGLVILFLAAVVRLYHPGYGFTSIIGFPLAGPTEPPALQAIPHYQSPLASYDGQFYAQRALDPLLRDPTIDRGMDLAPFRARRILFSWTAYVLGLGRPSWILEAYALQNVLCWLILAGLLTRWVKPETGRGLALWCAVLFSHGLLWSVGLALLDGPSLVLTMCAMLAVESNHPLRSAAIVGVAALGRETNVLVAMAQPIPTGGRGWLRLAVAGLLVVLPLLIWMDYLRSIYRSTTLVGTDSFVLLGTGLVSGWGEALSVATRRWSDGIGPGCIIVSLAAQAAFVFVRRDHASPWWRVACAYAVMLLFLDPVLAHPQTGAITRVMLPLTVGFNVLLAKELRPTRFWSWFLAGNLHLVPAFYVLPLVPWH
jgi:hypothetical protein